MTKPTAALSSSSAASANPDSSIRGRMWEQPSVAILSFWTDRSSRRAIAHHRSRTLLNFFAHNFCAFAAAFLCSVSFPSTIGAESVPGSAQPRDFAKYIESAPPPEYPFEARLHRLVGSGVALLKIEKNTGDVRSVTMLRITGHKILDEAVLKAYRGWRFKPHTISEAHVPVTFSMTGVPAESANAARDAINAPPSEYPIEARMKNWTGSGSVLMEIDSRTGYVTSARMIKSTGRQILDDPALKALRKWQFRPGTWSPVRIPITFTTNGAKYEIIALRFTTAVRSVIKRPIAITSCVTFVRS